jgi:hypothetical protein
MNILIYSIQQNLFKISHYWKKNKRKSISPQDGHQMVYMKFKFLQNISHYCNNIFSFHMPMFIIFVLSFNKPNTTVHSKIKFMVIAYNQNLHFRIHYKKLQKQYYNSFHHNLTLQKIHTKINIKFIVEVCVFLYC